MFLRSRITPPLIAAALLAGPWIATAPASANEAPDPVEFARLDSYSEGPVFDYEGNLYVSQSRGNTVWKIAPDGKRTDWLKVSRPNGHKILPDGTHLLCAGDAVLRLSADGRILGKAAFHRHEPAGRGLQAGKGPGAIHTGAALRRGLLCARGDGKRAQAAGAGLGG